MYMSILNLIIMLHQLDDFILANQSSATLSVLEADLLLIKSKLNRVH